VRFIQLTKIVSARTPIRDFHSDTDDVDEGASQDGRAVVTMPVSINVDTIRFFNPRKDNLPGTRLTFTVGRGFAVTNSYEEVLSLLG